MTDKDKEAFENWVWDNFNLTYELNPSQYDDLKDSWQAACEYKQKVSRSSLGPDIGLFKIIGG